MIKKMQSKHKIVLIIVMGCLAVIGVVSLAIYFTTATKQSDNAGTSTRNGPGTRGTNTRNGPGTWGTNTRNGPGTRGTGTRTTTENGNESTTVNGNGTGTGNVNEPPSELWGSKWRYVDYDNPAEYNPDDVLTVNKDANYNTSKNIIGTDSGGNTIWSGTLQGTTFNQDTGVTGVFIDNFNTLLLSGMTWKNM